MDRTRTTEVLREIEARCAGAAGSTPEKASQRIAAKLVANRASERDSVTVYQDRGRAPGRAVRRAVIATS